MLIESNHSFFETESRLHFCISCCLFLIRTFKDSSYLSIFDRLLLSTYCVWCTFSLLKKWLKRKSTCSFSSFDYPSKCHGIESGEGLVTGREWKRAASSSSSSSKYIIEIIVCGRWVHFGVVESRESAVDQKSRGRQLMQIR